MAEKTYDVVVIGGGPAGYVAAIKAAREGAVTAVVEKDVLGGTCLNRGCIPTKNFLKSAEFIYEMAEAKGRGIMLADESFTMDMGKAVKNKNRVVKKLTGGVGTLLKANGVDVFKGTGRALSASRVLVTGAEGEQQLSTKTVILAGGSEAAKLPIPGAESALVLTSDEILNLDAVPERLAIVGGGVIGVEMAMVFSAFGSKVLIVELEKRVLPFMDEETAGVIQKSLVKKGIDVRTGVKLSRFEESEGGIRLFLEDGTALDADKALFSIGRRSDLSCVEGLEIESERGKISVNEEMESSIPGIYAPGDINGRKMLAHAAFKMGETAAVNAARRAGVKGDGSAAGKVKAEMKYVPSVVYSIPEAAAVGLTEAEAGESFEIAVGRFPLAANGRALASGVPEGFVKVIADAKYGEILGVHIAGHGASEIINEAAALMAMEITVHEVAEIVHGHPTISEAFMEAAADCLGACIHLPPAVK